MSVCYPTFKHVSIILCIIDARRMKEIRLFLAKLRLTAEKVEKPKKEVSRPAKNNEELHYSQEFV